MSQAYNPYTPTPNDNNDQPLDSIPLRNSTRIFIVLFIILGAIGILQTFQTAFQLIAAFVTESASEKEAPNAIRMSSIPGGMPLAIVTALINAAVSIAEVVGGVMAINRKLTGAKLLKWLAIFMIFFKIAETVYGCIAALSVMDQIKAQAIQEMNNAPNAPNVDMDMIISIGMYIGLGLVILMGVFMLVFYAWAASFFGKKTTLAQFKP